MARSFHLDLLADGRRWCRRQDLIGLLLLLSSTGALQQLLVRWSELRSKAIQKGRTMWSVVDAINSGYDQRIERIAVRGGLALPSLQGHLPLQRERDRRLNGLGLPACAEITLAGIAGQCRA